MGKITGFMEIERELPSQRPIAERIKDWDEIYREFPLDRLRHQAARCMDCGVPFCHDGCTLHNVIPAWNDWVYRDRWPEAVTALHSTNNFPEFTGRVCPALCESSCVVGIHQEPVAIRQVELTIAEEGFKRGLIQPILPRTLTGKKVAVVGSGPAGLAASQQLTRAGHSVTLFEKNAQAGGLLRYGIPDFKLEKWVIDRRLAQMVAEGLTIRTGVRVGVDLSVEELTQGFDAILLTCGSEIPRDLKAPGRELTGIHFAMNFLAQQNRRVASESLAGEEEILATGKQVVVIGGGDTGADCVGTSVRQGAASITQIELLPRPPKERSSATPWPQWPHMLRTSSSHMEGGERMWSMATKEFLGEHGRLSGLRLVRLAWREMEDGTAPVMSEIVDSEIIIKADLVLLAMGFLAPVYSGLLGGLGVALDSRGNVKVNQKYMTSVAGVFAAGDTATGQSLVLKVINGGRCAARAMDDWLRT